MNFPKKLVNAHQAKLKIARYCAFQDRCEYEVRTKLRDFGLNEEEIEELIDFLIDEKYLDEDRFTHAYVQGKFNLKKWGKVKIKAHLRSKNVSESLIQKHLIKLPEDLYRQTITLLIQKKTSELKDENPLKRKQKVIAYLQQKGFEMELIFDCYEG